MDTGSKTVSVDCGDPSRESSLVDRFTFKVSLTQNYEQDVAEFRKLMKIKEISYEPSSSTLGVQNINRDKLNMIVHADIIKHLISDCALKILVCDILPYLMREHRDLLDRQFPAEFVEYIRTRLLSSTSLLNQTYRKFTTITGNYVDLDLLNLAATLLPNLCIRKLALKLKTHTSSFNRNLYDALYTFIAGISVNLEETAEEVTYKHKMLSDGYILYKERLFLINRNRQKFEQLEREANQKISHKNAEIGKFEKKIAKYVAANKQQLHEIVDKSQHKMMKKSAIVGEELQLLQEQSEHFKAQYQSLLANHLAIEKELRKKKRRVESTLQNWLGKYDDDMVEKQVEVDMLKESLEQEVIEYNELQCLFLEDHKKYEKYTKEKKVEDDNAIKAKAVDFQNDRATKVIQAAWKEFKRIQALKKGRRKKR